MKKRILATVVVGVLTLSGCVSTLPPCDSSEAQDLIQQIINQRSYLVGSFVDVQDIEETAFNKDAGVRICSARLITSRLNESISYSIKWQNKEENLFYLEINE